MRINKAEFVRLHTCVSRIQEIIDKYEDRDQDFPPMCVDALDDIMRVMRYYNDVDDRKLGIDFAQNGQEI